MVDSVDISKAASPGQRLRFKVASQHNMEAAKPWYRWRGALLVTALVVANVVCLTSAGVASLAWPELLTPALLAWTFGLRHAVDADHIASIDNVTRNLLAKGIRSVAVGFWFSMGHSTIVFIVCCIVAFTSTAFAGSSIVARIGGVIGTCISAAFLYFIGILNLVVLGDVLWRHWHPEAATPAVDNASATLEEADAGGDHANLHFDFVKSEGSSSFDSDDSGDENGQEVEIEGAGAGSGDAPIAGPTGVLSRCCPRLLNMVDAPWKVRAQLRRGIFTNSLTTHSHSLSLTHSLILHLFIPTTDRCTLWASSLALVSIHQPK